MLLTSLMLTVIFFVGGSLGFKNCYKLLVDPPVNKVYYCFFFNALVVVTIYQLRGFSRFFIYIVK